MPRFDGRGPIGQGPGTGFGRGYCDPRRGIRRNPFGFRRGFGRQFSYQEVPLEQDKEQKIEFLKLKIDALEEEKSMLAQEIKELKHEFEKLAKP